MGLTFHFHACFVIPSRNNIVYCFFPKDRTVTRLLSGNIPPNEQTNFFWSSTEEKTLSCIHLPSLWLKSSRCLTTEDGSQLFLRYSSFRPLSPLSLCLVSVRHKNRSCRAGSVHDFPPSLGVFSGGRLPPTFYKKLPLVVVGAESSARMTTPMLTFQTRGKPRVEDNTNISIQRCIAHVLHFLPDCTMG